MREPEAADVRPILIVAPYDEAWALQRYLPAAARELEHPVSRRLEVVIDGALELHFRDRLQEVATVLFFAHDPLGPLHPRVHRYALELERACDEAGVRLLGRPEPLSRTCKSRQLHLLRRAGIRAPRALRLSHWRDALAGDRVPFPLVLRYDCGHASDDQGFAGPFWTPKELRRARLPEFEGWPERRGLAGLAAVEFFDTRCADGLYRTRRCWALGDRVVRSRLAIARFWHGHRTDPGDVEPLRRELDHFLHAEPTEEERRLGLAVARATGFDIAAIDFTWLPDGRPLVFDVNPYPGVVSWWADDPIFKRRIVEAFAALVDCGWA